MQLLQRGDGDTTTECVSARAGRLEHGGSCSASRPAVPISSNMDISRVAATSDPFCPPAAWPRLPAEKRGSTRLTPSAASCCLSTQRPMQNCATFVRSRQSMQLVRTTPDCRCGTRPR